MDRRTSTRSSGRNRDTWRRTLLIALPGRGDRGGARRRAGARASEDARRLAADLRIERLDEGPVAQVLHLGRVLRGAAGDRGAARGDRRRGPAAARTSPRAVPRRPAAVDAGAAQDADPPAGGRAGLARAGRSAGPPASDPQESLHDPVPPHGEQRRRPGDDRDRGRARARRGRADGARRRRGRPAWRAGRGRAPPGRPPGSSAASPGERGSMTASSSSGGSTKTTSTSPAKTRNDVSADWATWSGRRRGRRDPCAAAGDRVEPPSWRMSDAVQDDEAGQAREDRRRDDEPGQRAGQRLVGSRARLRPDREQRGRDADREERQRRRVAQVDREDADDERRDDQQADGRDPASGTAAGCPASR